MRLYHYTCEDVAKRISRRGFLRPWPQPLIGDVPLVWLTDLDRPSAVGLGLEPHLLTCNRVGVRYVVDVDDFERWAVAAPRLPLLPHHRERLERDRSPQHWFIVRRHVFALRDREYRPEVVL